MQSYGRVMTMSNHSNGQVMAYSWQSHGKTMVKTKSSLTQGQVKTGENTDIKSNNWYESRITDSISSHGLVIAKSWQSQRWVCLLPAAALKDLFGLQINLLMIW